jgi:hypothetical protein
MLNMKKKKKKKITITTQLGMVKFFLKILFSKEKN